MLKRLWINKKIIIILFLITLGIFIGIHYFLKTYNSNEVLVNNSNNYITNTNSLTMMYETDYQSGEYQVSSDNEWPQSGYTFNEKLSKCENGSALTWNDESKKILMQANTSDKCYVYFDKNPITLADVCLSTTSLASCIQSYYSSDGENNLYYHDANLVNGAQDNSYRYSGANPNNYVCFGSDEANCSADNLYRIIGVFNDNNNDYQVKLIKNSSIETLKWDDDNSTITSDMLSSAEKFHINSNLINENIKIKAIELNGILATPLRGSNYFSTSSINIFLNGSSYYNNLNENWKNKISSHSWYIGEIDSECLYSNVQTMYDYEIKNSSNTTYTTKIGLMYVSDYGYATNPKYWSEPLSNYSNSSNENWMRLDLDEWTIFGSDDPSNSGIYNLVFFIVNNGNVSTSSVNASSHVRPTFYLNTDVQYISGSGTIDDPIRIN